MQLKFGDRFKQNHNFLNLTLQKLIFINAGIISDNHRQFKTNRTKYTILLELWAA